MLFTWALERAWSQLMVTKNLGALNTSGPYESTNIGVAAPPDAAIGERWAVINEDGTTITTDRGFNVWRRAPGSSWYPDPDGDTWGGTGGHQGLLPRRSPGTLRGMATATHANGSRYPGAPETNDGQDNQCPGDTRLRTGRRGSSVLPLRRSANILLDRSERRDELQAGAQHIAVVRDV
jgi:hypothetical protein